MLGAFFLVTLGILAYYTLFLTDFTPFGDKTQVVVYFHDAGGLRQGDSVLIAGIRDGRVQKLTYDPLAAEDRRVTATLLLEKQVELRRGYTIDIEDATVLGGKQVAIDPGPAGAEVVPLDSLHLGRMLRSPLIGLGEVVNENRARVDSILANIDAIVAGVRSGEGALGRVLADQELAARFADGIAGFAEVMSNVQALSGDMRAGKGAIGRLLQDETLYQEIEAITTDLRAIVTGVQAGEGALGRLLRDEKTAAEVTALIADVSAVAARLRAGEGTFGRLLTDDSLARNMEGIAADLNEGRGTLGRLLSDEEIFERLASASADLQEVSSALAEGRGTLGRLMMDDKLYREIETTFAIVTRSLEEFRESAPVTTFTSVLFGAF
jgi:phospholipid/cholesterol/gamma-HCH transport system substrate-binding protein